MPIRDLVAFMEPEERAQMFEIERVLNMFALDLDDLGDKELIRELPINVYNFLDEALDGIDYERLADAMRNSDGVLYIAD